jgi:glyoxylase-like metal-dependent hydrolase (beta-lactamase superfamily II)
MLPAGIEGIQCDLSDNQQLEFAGWTIRVVETPGHTPDHISYLAEHAGSEDQRIVFCGDAICAPGKIWTPYTTDWHHATADGLTRAAESLRRLAALRPTLLCPEHGPPIHEEIQTALETTTRNLQQAAAWKSFEQFRQTTEPNTPLPPYVAPDQVGSATPAGNTKPWTRLSPHLFLTGNTYALASAAGPVLLVDPYDRGLRERLTELKQTYGFGPAEVALVSHAHNDHYTGVFALNGEPRVQVWTLDRIADVVATPNRIHAPYVDPRPVRVDRRLKPGQTITWREYSLKVEHQPGQTTFAMSVEVQLDGRRVMFTGDNFYRADQYTGSGGWSGLNRGLPLGYAASIGRILERSPDWILAEHGGAMDFDRQDFELRKRWAQAAALAADALSPSGNHRQDWDPHRVRIDPLRLAVVAGQSVDVEVAVTNPTKNAQRLNLSLDRTSAASADVCQFTAAPGDETRRPITLRLPADASIGRHILTFSATTDDQPEPADVFLVLEVQQPGTLTPPDERQSEKGQSRP